MISLPLPKVTFQAILSVSVPTIKDSGRRDSLGDSVKDIVIAEEEFFLKMAPDPKLAHTILIDLDFNQLELARMLKGVYKEKVVAKRGAARRYYDEIFMSSPGQVCPYCNERAVGSIDHYLPKSKYPKLSFVPVNMVPSCVECNRDKLEINPESSETHFLHPYFDTVDEKWLECEVEKIDGHVLAFRYEVSMSLDAQSLTFKRLKFHLDTLKLDVLYSIKAAVEFSNIYSRLKSLFDEGGHDLVLEYLEAELKSRKLVDINSWRTCLYEALIVDYQKLFD